MYESSNLVLNSANKFKIFACIEISNAATDSSKIRILGFTARALAITTLCL